jgi:hypothetical protein
LRRAVRGRDRARIAKIEHMTFEEITVFTSKMMIEIITVKVTPREARAIDRAVGKRAKAIEQEPRRGGNDKGLGAKGSGLKTRAIGPAVRAGGFFFIQQPRQMPLTTRSSAAFSRLIGSFGSSRFSSRRALDRPAVGGGRLVPAAIGCPGSSTEEVARMNFPNRSFVQPPPKCRSRSATLSARSAFV